ncbi:MULTISPECIES: PerC family transcriptional regulator [Scandinavium]|uniref:PerC transcriptional activator n=1 Tax=Scandinavium goeteborgense TaxID=1851514 RepID=A0A4R6ENJ1_SCAGO|nr:MULTISPECIES: PerC family transcriptional regulator [Scandinavium]MCS2149658.1 PerC family transcriptional regulator [Scandinavium manionii]TDN60799.1 PerC transcriptional activator [Scandinavium goeteborgense]
MKGLSRAERYRQNYVPLRRSEKVVAETAAALEIETRAVEREGRGQYRIAARLWLECMDAAKGEVERARIAVRRNQCIARGNGLRRGEYSGIATGCGGVVYE